MHTAENLLSSVRMQPKINSSFLQQSQNKVLFLMSRDGTEPTNFHLGKTFDVVMKNLETTEQSFSL